MRFAIALVLAAGFTAAPLAAQGANMANTVAANETAMAVNAQQPVLPVTNEEAAAVTPAATPAPAPSRRGSFPWGLIGLVGLVGLLGRARS
jgi:hypothetical protein